MHIFDIIERYITCGTDKTTNSFVGVEREASDEFIVGTWPGPVKLELYTAASSDSMEFLKVREEEHNGYNSWGWTAQEMLRKYKEEINKPMTLGEVIEKRLGKKA